MLPGYDDWKTHNPDDDRCEFCGVITVEMPWATIRSTSETGLAEYILKQMREARDAVN